MCLKWFIHDNLFYIIIVKSGGIKAFRFMVNREVVILVIALWVDLKTCNENKWIDGPLSG